MMCWFQLFHKVIQLYMYIYLLVFKFFPQLGCSIILSRVPSAYLWNLKKKKVKMSLFAKQKQTHGLSKSSVIIGKQGKGNS